MTSSGPRSLPKYAKGGIMSSFGDVPLKTYSKGGIANSPQMAIFGEGKMPEAYVPLPDGRRIPVKMELPKKTGLASVTKLPVRLKTL